MNYYVDSHAHLHLCKKNARELIERAKAIGVLKIVNVATDIASSKISINLASQHIEVLATAGIHPSELTSLDQILELEILLAKNRANLVAIGEIGIDYYHPNNPSRELQIAGFRAQLELAKHHDLPVIIHTRNAAKDTLMVVKEFPDITKVFHCFSETPEFINEIANKLTYFSFTGMITYSNKSFILDSVRAVNIHNIMIETDCPYLTPTSQGKAQNEPSFLPEIAQKIAAERALSIEEVARITTQNAHTFFRF